MGLREALDFADELASYRAELTAENETALGVAQGQRIAWGRMKEDGLVPEDIHKMWVAQNDSRVCRVCEELDGQIVDVDELFRSDEGEYDGPPDPHLHCRCYPVLVDSSGEEVEAAAVLRVLEAFGNPYHDERGRFADHDASGDGGDDRTSVGFYASAHYPLASRDAAKSSRTGIKDVETVDGQVSAKVVIADPTTEDVSTSLGRELTRQGAVGWYDAATNTITINAPLYESRADDWRANKEAEKTGASASADPDATIHHEIGHAQHFANSGLDAATYTTFFAKWENLGFDKSLSQVKKIARSVSKYGATQPHEFVAEVFAGVLGGKKYGPDVWALYDALKGPAIKGGRK